MNQGPEAVSTRSLLGAFFAVVVLCAVFFSLGFFLGYRQSHPAASALANEQVPASSDVPPEVNPASATSEPAASVAANPESASQPAGSENSPDESDTSTETPPGPGTKPAPAADDAQALDSMIAPRVPSGLLVQVAAVTNRQDAANVFDVLKSKNYPALVLTPAQAKAKDNFYRVAAGPYRSRSEAERVRKELTAEGFKPFIR